MTSYILDRVSSIETHPPHNKILEKFQFIGYERSCVDLVGKGVQERH